MSGQSDSTKQWVLDPEKKKIPAAPFDGMRDATTAKFCKSLCTYETLACVYLICLTARSLARQQSTYVRRWRHDWPVRCQTDMCLSFGTNHATIVDYTMDDSKFFIFNTAL